MVPEKIDGLLVPVAMSGSHVAYTSFRHEPIWMAAGQAAGCTAVQALEENVALRRIDIARLQQTLVRQGQLLAWFRGLALDDPRFASVQLRAIAENCSGYDVETPK